MPTIPTKQVAELLAVLRDHGRSLRWTTRRDAGACLLGLKGLRITEVCTLTRSDLNPKGRAINVRTIKGGRPRSVPLDEETWFLCQRLAADAAERKSRYVFCTARGKPLDARNLRRIWREWSITILGTPYRFHDLRHTCARWVYEQTARDIFSVQRILGHSKIETTGWYLKPARGLRSKLPGGKNATRAAAKPTKDDQKSSDNPSHTGRTPPLATRGNRKRTHDHRNRPSSDPTANTGGQVGICRQCGKHLRHGKFCNAHCRAKNREESE